MLTLEQSGRIIESSPISIVREPQEVFLQLRQLLTGATLDEIRAHSTQVWLRFLSDRLVSGKLVYVDLVFGCPAYVGDAKGHKAFGEIDFFELRALFLADAYKCVGREVVGANVSEAGVLVIEEDDGRELILLPSDDDLEDDNWVWRLSADAQQGDMAGLRDVYCVTRGKAFEVVLRARS